MEGNDMTVQLNCNLGFSVSFFSRSQADTEESKVSLQVHRTKSEASKWLLRREVAYL